PAGAARVGLAALAAGGVRGAALAVFPVLAAAATTCLLEYARGARYARRLAGAWPVAAARLAARNRRRYGAYLAHLGVVVVAAGIAGSHFWQSERTATLSPGQSVTVAGHTLTYTAYGHSDNYGAIRDEYAVLKMGDESLQPSRVLYSGLGGQAVTRVAIRSTMVEDVYVVLADVAPDHATVNVFVNPLVTWIWAGAAILVLGILLGNLGSAVPAAAPVRARVAAPAT